MLCLLLFLPTLTTLLLDRLGLALTARATALASLGALTLVLVVAAIGMLRGRLRVEWSAWALAELLTLLGVALGAAWHLLALAGAPYLPLGISVDGGLHYALVDHLMEVRALGVKSGRLGELDAYTPGYHLLVLLGALWSGAAPIYLLYPVAALYLALGIAALSQLAMECCPAGPWRPLLGLCA